MQYRYPLAKPVLGHEEQTNLIKCIADGWVSAGSFVTDFEKGMSEECDRIHACATTSGTTALHLALSALGIGPGKKVLVPTLTYIATVNAILYCGATPVFCDSRKSDWQMDEQEAANAIIRESVDAVIAVHLYGAPCDVTFLEKFCKDHKVLLIEDAAEAIGSELDGRPVGNFGDASCFSFFGNKNITTGEGGMVLTDDPGLALKMKHLRSHATFTTQPFKEDNGWKKSWRHDELGYNYRMTNLQAAVGCAQLDKLEDILIRKQEICELYTKEIFRPIARNEISGGVETWRLRRRGVEAGRWLYSLVTDTQALRDGLIHYLYENRIESRPFFEPCHLQNHTRDFSVFPVAESLSRRGINLPTYADMTDEDVKYISGKVVEFLRHNVR